MKHYLLFLLLLPLWGLGQGYPAVDSSLRVLPQGGLTYPIGHIHLDSKDSTPYGIIRFGDLINPLDSDTLSLQNISIRRLKPDTTGPSAWQNFIDTMPTHDLVNRYFPIGHQSFDTIGAHWLQGLQHRDSVIDWGHDQFTWILSDGWDSPPAVITSDSLFGPIKSIRGDSGEVIRRLWDAYRSQRLEYNQVEEKYEAALDRKDQEYYALTKAMAEFLNGIPSYLEDKQVNPAWPRLWKLLKAAGWRVRTLKHPKTIPPPCN